ncbi:hypothetical protein FNV43_RR11319 [Rhamnella rubrinervis]|uniref:Glutamate receptor n=1 Tax=Rhamnella rubrinervis TaxID=2594499 RepID=A0A8K0H5M0_9ROSA|nr:hypothetical protein FNV43_RR11319 [Rhamnella rubrinervis]
MIKNPANIYVLSVIFLLSVSTPGIVLLVWAKNNTTAIIQVNVGVVLSLDSWIGKMRLSSFNMGLSDFYAFNAHYRTRLLLHTRDPKGDVVAAAAAAVDLIKNVQVQAIVGPATSMEAAFVIELGDKARVPIISFSATSPSLTSIRSPYFFRVAKNDSSQVKAISAVVQAFGWREAVPIYVNNEFGEGIIPYLTDALQEVDTRVPYRSVISPNATDETILAELKNLMTMQTRVFIVHMTYALGSRLFTKANEIGMMNKGYVWIMTDGITNFIDSLNSSVIDSMQGVLGVRSYFPETKLLDNFTERWKIQFQRDNPSILNAELDISGLWGYDAAFALAMTVEDVFGSGTNANFSFQNMNNDSASPTDLETFGVSQNGPEIAQALSSKMFKGLAGDFRLVDGQLQSSIYEITNVNGRRRKGIGFWTLQTGLEKILNSTNSTTKYSTANTSLSPILWPGDSSAPKGWEIPIKGKRLRIGVPVKNGFLEFVNVTYDPSTNEAKNVTGYSIDVFKAVLRELPYSLPHDFVPFAMPNGTSSGTYSEFVYQVFLKKYDAAVGDITIRASRSLYVDFTLPYTESGVSMIVPIKDYKRKDAWAFLKPLTWDLWVTTGCFFIFIGFVVWVLEHRINEDFRGPPLHQIGTSFWFSFSTMVFAHRERVVSNQARFVVIVWCFVVLILTQSYTASLTSLLTVQQLQPTVTDVNQLLKTKQNVGYQRGSFVYDILKELGFEDSNLKIYNSPEELYQLFTNKSRDDSVAAAFDETTYLKPFLAKYCSRYIMVEPTFKANGFAFVFPRGSSLVGDVSRAILNVTEGEKMKQIENAWFVVKTNCPDSTTEVSSSSLGLNSFWGLFVIAGISSLLALVIYAAVFLHEHRQIFMSFDSETSIWGRIRVMYRMFDQKDLSFHTSKKTTTDEQQDRRNSCLDGVQDHVMDVIDASRNTNCPPSPSNHSNQS